MTVMTEESPATRAFVLPPDVLFVAAENLAEEVRDALHEADGHIAVTRPGFRCPSRLVDEATASLLEEFRTPSTIAEAVVRFSTRRDLDPIELLDQAFPVLRLFSDSRILVPEGSPDTEGAPVSLATGQMVDGFQILTSLQSTRDTEVYRARSSDGRVVALKIEQRDAPDGTVASLVREQDVLSRIGGVFAPELVAAGRYDDRNYIAASWFEGVPVSTRAAEIRHRADSGWRQHLHHLTSEVLRVFAQLHDLGVIHGDTHAGNILVNDDDEVCVIDFGMSRQIGRGHPFDHEQRGGFGHFLDPGTCRTILDTNVPPPPDFSTERYALAALTYELVTSQPYLNFSPEVTTAYEQIVHDAPLPFTRAGFESWPDVEQLLQRALAKLDCDRFATTREFADAVAAAQPPQKAEVDINFAELTERTIAPFVPQAGAELASFAGLFEEAPTVAADQGAVGYAWFLYRTAILNEDPHLLARADIWCRRAAAAVHEDHAFFIPTPGDEEVEIDDCSVLHRLPGIAYVHALVSLARGDYITAHCQVEAFIESSLGGGKIADVALGSAGTLLAGSSLLDAIKASSPLDPARLLALLDRRSRELALHLDSSSPPGLIAAQPLSYAHGWPGVLHALLRNQSAVGGDIRGPSATLRQQLATTLDGLSCLRDSDVAIMAGWCNGTAGLIPLLTTVDRLSLDDRAADLAEWAASHAALHPDRHGHLCCGIAGRIFGLLEMYRHTGQSRWVEHARSLGRHLVEPTLPERSSAHTHGLFWGQLGAALALAELREPERAAMPYFGDFGMAG